MKHLVVACLSVFLILGAARGELKTGDSAPPLKISKWIKGKPVKLSEGKGKQTYVVEFWATWCGPCIQIIPHMTKLAKHFKKYDVVFIGVNIDNPATQAKVEPFVKKMGDKMGYTVAMDDGVATQTAYMAAAGVNGIPHVFLISKEGKIAWHGHPMMGLDLKLAELVGDKSYAESVRKLKSLQDKFMSAAQGERWNDALSALDQLIELDPEEKLLLLNKYRILIKKKDEEAAKEWGNRKLLKIDDSEFLNELAWRILADSFFEGQRDIDLALSAAKKANDMTEGKNWMILDTYARALFETKSGEQAIEVQKKAIEIAKKERVPKQTLNFLEKALERYEKK